MLILPYSDDCGNNQNVASDTQYHQKNGFRNLGLPILGYIFKFFLSTGLDKKEKNRLILTCPKSILRIA